MSSETYGVLCSLTNVNFGESVGNTNNVYDCSKDNVLKLSESSVIPVTVEYQTHQPPNLKETIVTIITNSALDVNSSSSIPLILRNTNIGFETQQEQGSSLYSVEVGEQVNLDTDEIDGSDLAHYGESASKRTRNKRPNPLQWKRNLNKTKRMKGTEYVGYQNKQVETNNTVITRFRPGPIRDARKMGPRCEKHTQLTSKGYNCGHISESTRNIVFKRFWNMTWGERKIFVACLTELKPVRGSESKTSQRSDTILYYIPKSSSEKFRVCKEMFVSTFCIGKGMLYLWLKGRVTSTTVNMPKEIGVPQTKLRMDIKEFLSQLPKLPSHYCRAQSTKLYLEPIVKSQLQLYNLYVTKNKNTEFESVSRWTFDQVFDDMNISLFRPKKDQCDTCVEFKSKNIEESVWKLHMERKEKSVAKSLALKKKAHAFTMDLQAVKQSPKLEANMIYYKSKLCVHNFTVFNLANSDATCYWWMETEGELVSSVFVSCLISHLEQYCNDQLPIYIVSDGCTYQNRNVVMSNALLNLAMKHKKLIFQQFLEKGHTQMECDAVHSAIERNLKNEDIYLPSDYNKATKSARQNPRPYESKFLTHSFFQDNSSKQTQRYDSICPGKSVGDPCVFDIRALKYDPSGDIYYKINVADDWTRLLREPIRLMIIDKYPSLYHAQLPIPMKKFKDLQDLKKLLPVDCHSFYETLPYQAKVSKHTE